jgi:hypothetical protein
MEMGESRELKNRRMVVEIMAQLHKHCTGRMMEFKLSEYIHGPRYGDALDRRGSHSEINA